MSNPENEQRKPKMNNWVWLLLTIIACCVVGIIVYNNNDTIARWANHSRFGLVQEVLEKDSITTEIQSELVEEAENPTIVEYLQYREDMIEQYRRERVFMTMPIVVIVDILRTHGTALSPWDIVEIYENYPETYNQIQSGARSQQYLDSIQGENREPDPLPLPAPIDSGTVTNTYLTNR